MSRSIKITTIEQAEDHLAQEAEHDDQYERGQERLRRDPLSHSRGIPGREAEKDRRVRDRIHDGEKPHEN